MLRNFHTTTYHIIRITRINHISHHTSALTSALTSLPPLISTLTFHHASLISHHISITSFIIFLASSPQKTIVTMKNPPFDVFPIENVCVRCDASSDFSEVSESFFNLFGKWICWTTDIPEWQSQTSLRVGVLSFDHMVIFSLSAIGTGLGGTDTGQHKPFLI